MRKYIANLLISVPIYIFLATLAPAQSPQALLDSLKQQIQASDKMSAKVKEFAINKLLPQSTNEVLVKETEAQNAKKVSVDEIKKIDKAWVAAEDELPIQKELKNNTSAKELKKITEATKGFDESFLKDDQGANVGMTSLTTNYYHGDKDKWKKCFNEGKGALFVGELKLDKSANKELQQISLPLINAKGQVVGVMIWGVEPAKIE